MYPLISATLPLFAIPVHCPFFSFAICGIPYGLAVKIPGFHPGGPGSTSGMGTPFFECTNFAGAFLEFYKALRLVKVTMHLQIDNFLQIWISK